MRHLIQKLPTSLATLVLLLATSTAGATTILGMDIDEVAKGAEFIFEGEVILSETRQDGNTGIISTYVTFNIFDVVKGDYDANSIELKFMGGVFNGEIVQVSGLRIPQLGEQGIYFVESTSRDLINPLLGWSQGHFIITDENGQRSISTADNKPVTNVQAVAAIPSVIKKPQTIIEGDNDAALGIVTETRGLRINRALSVEQFKLQIHEIIEN